MPNGMTGDPARGADLDDPADLLGRAREGDRIGRGARMVGLVLAVALADRLRGGQPIAEDRAEIGKSGGERGEGGVVHGLVLYDVGSEGHALS